MFRRANEFEMNSNFVGDNNTVENEMNVDIINNNQMNNENVEMNSTCCDPVTESVQERCVHRTIYHEVPHVCPIRTRVINHHIYRHTYRPEYSCCEENTVSNVQCGSCCNFR